MKRILAIADDFSGAAEIAGIGFRCGLPTRLLRGELDRLDDGLTVVDTDSRLLRPAEAAGRVREVLSRVSPADFGLVYKKTDSVMRGSLRQEIETIASTFAKSAALLVPQNPSRGRIIRGGTYLVDGVPLHQTSFADDPDHPARSADVRTLLDGAHYCELHQAQPTSGITIGAAESTHDVRQWAGRVTPQILPAGGADFFTALLQHFGLAPSRPFATSLAGGNILFVCGSASSQSRQLIARACQGGIPVCDVSDNAASICSAMRNRPRVLLAIAQPLDRSPGAGQRLQTAMADLVAAVLARKPVQHLLLEGGATAAAVCGRMSWQRFQVEGELGPGVVQLHVTPPGQQRLIVKPGSYPWPDAVW